MIKNLEIIRDNGMEMFLEKEEAKWRCSQCGGIICCHNGLCLDCNIEMLNLKTCGSNGRHSQETRDKISKGNKGNKNASGKRSKEFKGNCRIRLLGKPSNMLNKKHNNETKDKISKANKGKPAINKKQIINIETGEIYSSLVKACIEMKISLSTLSYYLNNKLPNKTTLRWHKQY